VRTLVLVCARGDAGGYSQRKPATRNGRPEPVRDCSSPKSWRVMRKQRGGGHDRDGRCRPRQPTMRVSGTAQGFLTYSRRAFGIRPSRVASSARSAQLSFRRRGCRRCRTATWVAQDQDFRGLPPQSSRRDSRSHAATLVIRGKRNRSHMIGDHHGPTTGRQPCQPGPWTTFSARTGPGRWRWRRRPPKVMFTAAAALASTCVTLSVSTLAPAENVIPPRVDTVWGGSCTERVSEAERGPLGRQCAGSYHSPRYGRCPRRRPRCRAARWRSSPVRSR
jgi:hypothetical protein